MDINALKQDRDLAETGVWVDYEDASFLICSTDSKRYRRAVTRIAKKRNPASLRKDPEAMHEVTVESLAEGILIDWKNVKDGETNMPATLENKIRVCGIESIRTFLATEAQDLNNFQREALAEDAADLKSGD